MARTINNANSSFALQVEGLFPVPVSMKGYSADDMFSVGTVDTSERMFGVDGRLTAGYVFKEKPFKFVLMADSESNDVMDAWLAAEDNAREKLIANAVVILDGIEGKFAMTRGFLGDHNPIADAKKVLQPRSFTINFQSISKAPT